MIVVTIIGILASIAAPSYQRYINEAKATQVLVNIHGISLSYLDSSYDSLFDHKRISSKLQQLYQSADYGKAPSAFSGKDALYSTKDGIQLYSSIISSGSQSSVFHKIIARTLPVVFIKATSPQSNGILHALNHITQQEHVFITPSIMVVALSSNTSLHHTASQAPTITHHVTKSTAHTTPAAHTTSTTQSPP